jgi:hypothetical protein
VIFGAALAVKLAGPMVAAVGELLHIVLIVAAVIVGAGAAGLVGLLAWRWRRWRSDAARTESPRALAPVRAAQPLAEPRRAIERAPEVHLHLHGVSAKDIAAILARQDGQDYR